MIILLLSVALGEYTFEIAKAPTSDLERHWPPSVKRPANLRVYRKTQYGQRLTITDGYDQNIPFHVARDDHNGNGNNKFPWAVPGGTDNVRELSSIVAISLPEKEVVWWWEERIEAGARRPLPKVTWSFPAGTRVYDLLLHKGKPFELRMLRKEGFMGKPFWKGHTLWESGEWPPGYRGINATGRKCNDCHNKAGQWERYGPLVRGNDYIFSWSAFREGTLIIDPEKPVKHWSPK